MLLLLTTLYGWTQSSSTWVISNNGVDTTIVYTFTKLELRDLRLYITDLEQISELYDLSLDINEAREKQIVNLQKQVSNQSESLRLAKEVFTLQQDELKKSDKLLQVQINETLKYKKRAGQWPIWLGSGTAIGVVTTCLLLIR